MIAYFEASALVKRYVSEHRSAETTALSRADVVATSLVSRAAVAAALARAARSGVSSSEASG